MTTAPDAAPAPVNANANTLFLQAIALKLCVRATYNRQTMLLAPHILYTRHDDVFVDAVTVEREGQPPREIKLGTFKLAGLNDISVEDRPFKPYSIFNAGDIKYDRVTLFAVEPA